MRPGGEEEGGGGEDHARSAGEGQRQTRQTHRTAPLPSRGGHRPSAPPPGQEHARTRVAPPGEGASGWLCFHCPFLLFSEPWRHRAGLCVPCRRPARPGRLSGSQPGRRGDRGRGSPSSLASTIPCATPWLAPPKQHRLSSGASDAEGREERESGRERGQGAVAAAARAGLDEQSHSPAAHAVEKAKEAESWWVQACHAHSRCFVC